MDRQEVLDFMDDVKSRLKIDDSDLVEECKKQPAFYLEVASELPRLKSLVKTAKRFLDFTKAELELAIRKEPEKYDLKKTTEITIASVATIQRSYQDALKVYDDAQELADAIQHCVISVEHRKSMIRDIVSLWGDNYRNQDMTMWDISREAGDQRANEIATGRRNRNRNERSEGQG